MIRSRTTAQDQLIVQLLSGNTQQAASHGEVAKRLGVSEFLVRRVEQEAFRKLRRTVMETYQVTNWDES
jgi:DNA-directed RNA polymerase sigma subunit (sigma70/sigma32)